MQNAELETAVDNELQKRIIDLLESKGPLTRADMVHYLQVARTTIYDALVKLMGCRAVGKHAVGNNKRGRPKVVFQLFTTL